MCSSNRVIWIYTDYPKSALILCVKMLKIVYVQQKCVLWKEMVKTY